MGILRGLLRTVTSPVEVSVRTLKNICDDDDRGFPLLGSLSEAIHDTSDGIVNEFDEK